jgi:hypothetical protein
MCSIGPPHRTDAGHSVRTVSHKPARSRGTTVPLSGKILSSNGGNASVSDRTLRFPGKENRSLLNSSLIFNMILTIFSGQILCNGRIGLNGESTRHLVAGRPPEKSWPAALQGPGCPTSLAADPHDRAAERNLTRARDAKPPCVMICSYSRVSIRFIPLIILSCGDVQLT